MTGLGAERAATIAGVVTIGFGVALTVAPSRSALGLGLGDHPRLARVIGLADLGLGLGLLASRPRWPWMAARAIFNLALASHYQVESRQADVLGRARIGAVAMTALTLVDGGLAAALRARA